MNKYELAVVISAKIDDEARADVLERAKALITRFGGQIGEIEEWGKRKLAYEIQKQTEAYYYFINFEAETHTPAEIEGRMRIMENVLRYLVVRKDENDTFVVTPEKTSAPADEVVTEEAPAEEVPAAEEAPAAEEEPAE